MHLARWREHVTQHLLGGGLADDPVTAMIFASVRARAATPSLARAASTSSTTIIGTVNRPMAGSLDSLTTSSAAPARHRHAGIVMAVNAVALDGEEGFTGPIDRLSMKCR